MNTQAGTQKAQKIDSPAAGPARLRWLAAAESLLVRAGERLNPILVKETRQALKSRQFAITFGLLLLFCWIWSILGVALVGPQIYYTAHGPTMFCGYYLILAFPLLVIVPFGAFRSLAGEQEERTYELLSITTLGPRQIVGGKLGSAVVQMLVYLSAISPCLGFTYMLRGIDFPTILFVLLYTTLASLAFSVVGLLLGTLTAEKHLQVILSVLAIVGLLLAFWIACALGFGAIGWSELGMLFGDAEFWQVNAAILTAYASYFALVFYAAAARLGFQSDNRSTRLRVVMLVQHVLLVGWMSWVWIVERGDFGVTMVFMVLIGLHWYVMGALMTGESPELSHRVKRDLPQSFLGRAFLTWLNPGPTAGYVFAICGLIGGLMVVLVGALYRQAFGLWGANPWSGGRIEMVLGFGVLGLAYVTIYLGLGLLVMRLLRRFARVGILVAGLVQVLLVTFGCGVPLVLQLMSPLLRDSNYSLLQVTNPLWTLVYVADRSRLPPEGPVLLVLVPLAAAIVFLLNLPEAARELRHVRIAAPERVAEEDAQLAARRKPPEPIRTSPWDET